MKVEGLEVSWVLVISAGLLVGCLGLFLPVVIWTADANVGNGVGNLTIEKEIEKEKRKCLSSNVLLRFSARSTCW